MLEVSEPVGESSVKRTVCRMFLCPSHYLNSLVSCPRFADAQPRLDHGYYVYVTKNKQWSPTAAFQARKKLASQA